METFTIYHSTVTCEAQIWIDTGRERGGREAEEKAMMDYWRLKRKSNAMQNEKKILLVLLDGSSYAHFSGERERFCTKTLDLFYIDGGAYIFHIYRRISRRANKLNGILHSMCFDFSSCDIAVLHFIVTVRNHITFRFIIIFQRFDSLWNTKVVICSKVFF